MHHYLELIVGIVSLNEIQTFGQETNNVSCSADTGARQLRDGINKYSIENVRVTGKEVDKSYRYGKFTLT